MASVINAMIKLRYFFGVVTQELFELLPSESELNLQVCLYTRVDFSNYFSNAITLKQE